MSAPQPALNPTPTVDARPIIHPVSTGVFARAEETRDWLYTASEFLLRQMGIDALVIKSPPQVHPCWVKVEGWLPSSVAMVTRRASFTVTINPMAFHRFDLDYSISLDHCGHQKNVDHVSRLDEPVLRSMMTYLFADGSRPSLSGLRFRTSPWQLWRDKNKIDLVGTDWLANLPGVLAILGMVTLGMSQSDRSLPDPGLLLLGGGLLVAGIGCWIGLARRPVVVRTTGCPVAQPRTLIRVDSWQTVISGAGPDLDVLISRFGEVLQHPPSSSFRSWLEKIWHWGLAGKEERDQRVMTMGRAMLFCHFYAYGSELYVGWDSHLNAGCWVEKTLVSGFDRESGKLTKFNTVVTGVQRVTEYDVTDVNCLSEWAHAQLVKTLKRYLDEKKIDHDIDFKILRGERQGLTDENSDAATKAGRGFFKRKKVEG